MPARELSFKSAADVNAELDRLARGCDKAGAWDLAQVCDHLDYFLKASLDGAQFKVPWLIKVLFGGMARRRILATGKMKSGVPTPQRPLPVAGGDPVAAIARLKSTLARFDAHQGEFPDSPFFGPMTTDEVRKVQFTHCAHHLGYLNPR